jgi:hypothetical protein
MVASGGGVPLPGASVVSIHRGGDAVSKGGLEGVCRLANHRVESFTLRRQEFLQYVVGQFLACFPGPANPHADPRYSLFPEGPGDGTHSPVPGRPSSRSDPDQAQGQVRIIIDDNEVACPQPASPAEGCHQQEVLTGPAGGADERPGFLAGRAPPVAGAELLDHHETDVVPAPGVPGPRVPEAHHQAQGLLALLRLGRALVLLGLALPDHLGLLGLLGGGLHLGLGGM